MKYISEKEYNFRMKQIKSQNIAIKRQQALKAEKNKYRKNIFSNIKTSNKILFIAVIAIIWFTVTSLYIQYKTGIEVSSTLTTLWFSFWTVEIVSLAGIKVSKVFKDYENKNGIDVDNCNEDDNVCG